MKIDDRSAIAEHFICQLWEKEYFANIPLKTTDEKSVTIISMGKRNFDAGPDFLDIAIKLADQIYQGDLEIHRSPEDWYQHKHHADPAYNNVIMHLIIGEKTEHEPAVRLNRQQVFAEVFVHIRDEDFPLLAKKYKLKPPEYSPTFNCELSFYETAQILSVINHFARERFHSKTERFLEQHHYASWNQVIYLGVMEALGYSKNQLPFRKLANLLPFEALARELNQKGIEHGEIHLQALLFGAAGLLPSQDPSFDWKKVKDKDTQNYIEKIESLWRSFSSRIGIEPMRRDQWLFFRLRPSNFPTRRIAGASLILTKFLNDGFLEKILKIVNGLIDHHPLLIKELEHCFFTKTKGYWATHYQLEQNVTEADPGKNVTLIGKERGRSIVINIILPVLLAYAKETEDSQLMIHMLQIYQQYPKTTENSVTKKMSSMLFNRDNLIIKKSINTAAKQQGLIHLYKLHCRRRECDRCQEDWKPILSPKR